jgi:predicted glutamine amidotransferase
MCIIIYNPGGQKLEKERLKVAYDNNPHGFGFMWIEDYEVFSIKGMSNFKDVWQLSTHLAGYSYALHFRWRTAGKIREAQCHPHTVLDKEKHGMNLKMMHNGTIFSMKKAKKGRSDTQVYASQLTNEYLHKHRNLHNLFESVHGEAPAMGTFNKFVFMADGNRVEIVNEDAGEWIDNMWYSNTYSFEKGYRVNQAAKATAQKQFLTGRYMGGSPERIRA